MDFFSEHKRAVFIITALACIIGGIITLNYKKPTFFENLISYIVSPTQEVTTNVSDWVNEKITFISDLHELEKVNKELTTENERLKYEAGRVEQLEKQNELLAAQLDLKPRYPALPLTGAYVTATDPNNWSAHFTISKGTDDGLAEDMAVLADGGLAGRIYKANKTSSLVMPVIDDSSSVGAETKRGGDMGFVKGDLRLLESGYCRMENIDATADILENDEIITSSLGEIFPPGIIIGYVKEIHMDPDGLTKQAIIQPVVDFKTLNTVLVVIEFPQIPAAESTESDNATIPSGNRP